VKILVLTGADAAMAEVHAMTVASKREWAAARGYDFLELRQWNAAPAIVWQKMSWIEQMLRIYDVVVWLDADALVTNPLFSVESLKTGEAVFHISEDWGPCDPGDEWWWFNTGNMVVQRAVGMEALWKAIWQLGREQWLDRWGFEQSTLQALKRDPNYARFIQVLPGKVLNAVPRCVQPTTRHPWDASCFLAHITGVPNARRVEILKGALS